MARTTHELPPEVWAQILTLATQRYFQVGGTPQAALRDALTAWMGIFSTLSSGERIESHVQIHGPDGIRMVDAALHAGEGEDGEEAFLLEMDEGVIVRLRPRR